VQEVLPALVLLSLVLALQQRQQRQIQQAVIQTSWLRLQVRALQQQVLVAALALAVVLL
jgi:hypothetical protein